MLGRLFTNEFCYCPSFDLGLGFNQQNNLIIYVCVMRAVITPVKWLQTNKSLAHNPSE